MKNFFLLLTATITFSASAQISLEHTYTDIGGVGPGLFSAHGTKYVTVEYLSTAGRINIYNTDHSHSKLLIVPAPSGYTFTYATLSDHLFDSDDEFEILATFTSTTSSLNKTIVYNEDGSELYDFGNIAYPTISYVDGSYKLIARVTSSTQFRVYSLPGELPCGHCSGATGIPRTPSGTASGTTMAMPNPAGDNISITYDLPAGTAGAQLTIYSADGRAIHTENLSKNSQSVMVSLSNHPAGVYHYTISAPGLAPINSTFTITQ